MPYSFATTVNINDIQDLEYDLGLDTEIVTATSYKKSQLFDGVSVTIYDAANQICLEMLERVVAYKSCYVSDLEHESDTRINK